MIFCSEMRRIAWTKGDFLVQVTLCETITTEFEFGWMNISQVGIEDAKRVEFGNMMTAHLVSTN